MYREQNTTGCLFPEEIRTSTAEYVQNSIWDRQVKKRNMAPGMGVTHITLARRSRQTM